MKPRRLFESRNEISFTRSQTWRNQRAPMFLNRKPGAAKTGGEPARPSVIPEQSVPPQSGSVLSAEVSITGLVKFRDRLLMDCHLKGNIDSTGMLTIGKHSRVRGDVRAKSVVVQGIVEGNIF